VLNLLSSSFLSKNINIKINRTVILPVIFYGCETSWRGGSRRLRVFENWMLRSMCGRKREEESGEWRKLHYEKLNDLYCSPNIIQVIKSTRMRWVGQVAYMGRGDVRAGFWWGKPRVRGHLEGSDIYRRTILIRTFRKWNGSMDWIDLAWERDR
jgi:hypothetical protein